MHTCHICAVRYKITSLFSPSGSNEAVGQEILQSQMAMLERLDSLVAAQRGLLATQSQLLLTQQQLVTLKAHKYGVRFEDNGLSNE